MKKILTKKTLTIAFVITVAGVIALNLLGILSFSAIGPIDIVGLRIKSDVLITDLNSYDFLTVKVATASNPATLKVFGESGGSSTDITSHFEPTTTYSGLTFNLTPLKTTGKGGLMPNPAVEYYDLIPIVYRPGGLLGKRYLRLDVSYHLSPGATKTFNPSPPYQPGL